MEERNELLVKQKQDLDTQVSDLSERVEEEEANNEKLSAAKRQLEKQSDDLRHDVEDLEGNIGRIEKDKQVNTNFPEVCFL